MKSLPRRSLMIVACLAWLPVQAQNQTLNASLTTIIQTLLADPLPSAPAATPALVLQPAPTMDPAAKSMTRKSAFEYDQVSGLLTAEIVEPDFEPYRLVTRYSYDAWGNKNAATVSAPTSGAGAVAPRTSTATYDAHGQFQVSRTNALGHIERATYDPKFGLPVSQTGPNGLTTQWQYDSFGRKTMEIRADGGRTSWTYFYCQDMASGASPCPALARYVIQISQLGPDGVTVSGPWNKLYFDAINRQIRSESPAFDGIQIVAVDTEYDDLGRVSRSSRPHFGSQTPQWTVQTYDELDRVIVTTAPDATQTKILYKGLTTRTTNAAGQTQSRFTNSQGQIIGVTDALGSAINYQYDPFGNLTRTVDPGGNFLGFTYDLRGRRTSTSDPDMGAIAYRYDALDQVIAQVDAKGQATTLRYDSLGRIVGRIEPGLTSTWIYDSCAKGIGKLCAARTSGGYSRSYSYDALGRGIGITTVIDRTYSSAVSFDANGRVATRTTPSGIVLRYVYSPFGYLQEVRNNLGNALFWRAAEIDAEGNLRQQLFGNNVATTQNFDPATGTLLQISAGEGNRIQTFSYGYDGLGRMTSRSNNSQGLTESFTYDVLNRLTAANVSTVSSGGTYSARQTNVYDSIGNIQSRSDVGSYAYGTPNRQPHALNTVTLNDASRVLRTYDANGNLVQQARVDAAGTAIPDKKSMTISYTSFNMPSQITAAGGSIAFDYGSEHQRIKETTSTGNTIYLHPDNVGGLSYERETKANGSIEQRQFIDAGGQPVALVKLIDGTTSVNYLHRDGLGSTTAITDESGAVVERFAYEPFGRRRFVDGRTDTTDSISATATTRGFTNHEQLDGLGLIHMNGRIYDPSLGRFLSADPNIQSPGNLQSYNRYSYVMNSPLNATDPSGYLSLFGHKILPGVFSNDNARVAVVIGVAVFAPEILAQFPALGLASISADGIVSLNMTGGAVVGATGGLIASRGDTKAGIAGAVSGGLFTWAGTVGSGIDASSSIERYAAHAFAGCASGEVSGSGCARGTASAVFGKFATNATDGAFVPTVVAGGLASVAGGGKFANGALTSTYAYLFNYCHEGKCTSDLEQKLYDYWPGYKAGTLLYNQTMGDGSWTGWEVLDAASTGLGATSGGLKAAFNGGTNSVFWSGFNQGALVSASELGTTLEQTVGGRFLSWLNHGAGINVPDSVWSFASSTFANNARESVTAVIRAEGRVWTNIEKPILQKQGLPIRYVP